MISIIICSINKNHLSRISKNIEDTIGVPFEVLAIDNQKNPRGICAVYNEGANRAKFECLCFLHEDVQFNTKDWGKVLLGIFENKNWGLVGLAGAAHKPKMPSGWGAEGLHERLVKMNLIQHYGRSKPPLHQYLNTDNEKLAEVACVDGVFLASTKAIFQHLHFDESLLKGFHGYDLDLSLAIGQQYKIGVTFEIMVEHYSEGHLSAEWLKSLLIVHEKWAASLPRTVSPMTKNEKLICEKFTFRYMLPILKKNGLLKYSVKMLNLGELNHLNFLTYLKMYLSIGEVYFSNP